MTGRIGDGLDRRRAGPAVVTPGPEACAGAGSARALPSRSGQDRELREYRMPDGLSRPDPGTGSRARRRGEAVEGRPLQRP
ncbi:hypothetical protein GCM10010365_60100 [Streptomyces poonensis]|uniref:Uncharacterized protein n=1 Tax=Streptomyces poonensis TaxID=68255 RepID=A0A918Q2M3_9ACTN|nr:hypothetical protein GCM10010365_60100 [Streptomyces poonensis]GLJ88335.1 hypothetical protein GCM10017589_09350 [Streptomyces poonensis]